MLGWILATLPAVSAPATPAFGPARRLSAGENRRAKAGDPAALWFGSKWRSGGRDEWNPDLFDHFKTSRSP